MPTIIELTKNPYFMWFIFFGSLAITFFTWLISQNNNKWIGAYEVFKYLTAGCLLFMFFNITKKKVLRIFY